MRGATPLSSRWIRHFGLLRLGRSALPPVVLELVGAPLTPICALRCCPQTEACRRNGEMARSAAAVGGCNAMLAVTLTSAASQSVELAKHPVPTKLHNKGYETMEPSTPDVNLSQLLLFEWK